MTTEFLATALLAALEARGMTLATAESCTGGGVGAALTAIPGSSRVYLGGVISYTNAVKMALLGVPAETLETHTAVSVETARAMAQGACQAVGASMALSVTGLAGPSGDGTGRPVGLVYIGCATAEGLLVRELKLNGDRAAIRAQAVDEALALGLKALESYGPPAPAGPSCLLHYELGIK